MSSTSSNSNTSTQKPEVGDNVKINTVINSEIIEIENGIVSLFDGRKLIWNDEFSTWTLTIQSKDVSFYHNNVGVLPIHAMMQVLINADEEKFKLLCSTNHALRDICTGNLTQEFITKNGNLTKELYAERVKKFVDPDIIEFADPKLSWKQFYEAYIKAKESINNKNPYANEILINNILEKVILSENDIITLMIFAKFIVTNNVISYLYGEIISRFIYENMVNGLKYLFKIQPNLHLYQDQSDKATIDNSLDVVKFFASLNPPLLPNQNAINYADRHGHEDILDFLASLDPPLLPTN